MMPLALTFLLLFLSPNVAFAAGESINNLSHIHQVKVIDTQILLGTHEGLFRYINAGTVERVSPENFDVMGLSISGKKIYASGHPGSGSKLPQPVGLLLSTDMGKSWKKVSLQGKVDFHFLEVGKSEIYGGDSGSGDLMYSQDSGKTWINRGKNIYSDIVISPTQRGRTLAIENGKLFTSNDAFKSVEVIKQAPSITSIEWNAKRLIASSGKNLLVSKDSGKSWKTLYTFKNPIGLLAQSPKMLAAAVGNEILISLDEGKTFKKP